MSSSHSHPHFESQDVVRTPPVEKFEEETMETSGDVTDSLPIPFSRSGCSHIIGWFANPYLGLVIKASNTLSCSCMVPAR